MFDYCQRFDCPYYEADIPCPSKCLKKRTRYEKELQNDYKKDLK